MNKIAVIDFETTGLSPQQGARATEVAVVLLEGGTVIGKYQSLMNAGVHVPPEITRLTGITNEMVRAAPSSKQVMNELLEFVEGAKFVAHNATFDKKFLIEEAKRAGITGSYDFACTMLISRRLYRESPNHKLGTLVKMLKIPHDDDFHRALADAQMTTELLFKINGLITRKYGIEYVSHDLLIKIQKTKYADIDKVMGSFEYKNKPTYAKKKPIKVRNAISLLTKRNK